MRLSLLLLAAAPIAAAGQTSSPAPTSAQAAHTADVPSTAATRLTMPVRVDGRLDEAAWAAATPVTRFTQVVPTEGAAATERTEVRFLFDDDALYVGARLYDRSPVTTRLGRRDGPMSGSDWLTVIIDSYHDHSTAVGFEINPSGVRRDQTRSATSEDDSWDPVWEAQVTVDAEGWTAEMRIPFSQLRFNASTQVWGLQVERQIARLREFAVSSFTPSNQQGGIPRFGHLEGLVNLQAGKRLELLPYTVLRADAVDRSANPFRDDREQSASVGADLKYRVTSDLTLDLTVNPDFGQVEVDPAEVNLSAIETFFQEKRPFFIEGSELFRFGQGGGNNAFYTRRIGRAPQLLPNTEERDVADAARILGAAKLTGRTRSGWSVGVMNALTAREEVLYRTPDGDVRDVAEPLTNYFAGRVRRDLRGGMSALGGMVTAVNRRLDTDALRASLRSSAYMGGVDYRHEWARRTWALNGFVSGSYVQGSTDVITATQQYPWRYYQRPDATHLEIDSDRTSLAGLSTQSTLAYRPGRHWRFQLLGGTTTPGYEVNDAGFQYRADRVDGQASVTYVEPRPGKVVRAWNTSLTTRAERNYDFDTVMDLLQSSTSITFLNYWSTFTQLSYNGRSFDDRLTRGGPASARPTNWQVFLAGQTDTRRRVYGGIETSYYENTAGNWNGFVAIGVTARPTSAIDVTLTPVYQRSFILAQTLGSVGDALQTETFGRRWLFADLGQTTVRMDTRVNVTFSPVLSLQVYAQPYLSSAAFGAPGELRRPRHYEFDVYGRDIGTATPATSPTGAPGYTVDPDGDGPAASFFVRDRDFNTRSLRGNAVLRWEYRPGSTLFVAWQQTRDSFAGVGDFDFGRDRQELFESRPDNVLVVKVNYWLNP